MRTMLKSLLLLPALLGTLGVFAASDIAAEVEYFYAKDGTIIGRAVNGVRSDYEYDAKGQLLAVKDAKTGEVREGYTYDPAGNILSKSVYGATTVYTYDASNQLVSATANGAKTTYAYDAAGRLIRAGSKSYRYGFKDKVLEVRDGAKTRARFSYYMDGQLKQANYADRTENFMWDGLALAKRDGVNFINEPHVTGGNPVLAGNSVMFNDMLGSTLSVDGKSIDMTAFGDSDDPAAMFTGKPQVEELGHVFLFRNYRAELGKWQTADPLGYPDGWNQLAYCNNGVVSAIDWLGAVAISDSTSPQFHAAPVWQNDYVPPMPYDSVNVRGNDIVNYQILATGDGNDSGISGIQVNLSVTSFQSFGLNYINNGQIVWTPSNITGAANLVNYSIAQSSSTLANGDKEYIATITCYVRETASGYNHLGTAPLKNFTLTLRHTVAE